MNKKILILILGIVLLFGILALVSAANSQGILQMWRNTTTGANVTWVDYNGNIYALGSVNISGIFYGDGSGLTNLNVSSIDLSDYYTKAEILGFNYWNDTYATFNKTYADTLYYSITNPNNYLNETTLNLSQTNYWTLNGTDLYYAGGNVGIGTTSPGEKLEVAGNLLLNGSANNSNYIKSPAGQSLIFSFGTNNYPEFGTRTLTYSVEGGGYVRLDYGGGGTYQYDAYGSSWHMGYSGIKFSNSGGFSGADHFQITSNSGIDLLGGNVGIGTTIPQTPLHVAGAGLFNGTVTINNGTAAQHAVTLSQLQAGISGITETDPYWTGNSTLVIYTSDEGNLNVNSSDYWVTNEGAKKNVADILGSEITNDFGWINSSGTINNSNYLGGYPASFFMPLNTSVYGQFDFNGGWTSGGLSIINGNLYAQEGYFYQINSLQVSNLEVNGSLIPAAGFDNQFDIGNSTNRWRNGYFGGTLTISNGTSAQHAVTLSQLQAVNVSAGVETDPHWTGNSTLVPYLASANTFTANNIFNQNLTVDGTTFFVNSNANRVGIGTTSPGAKLDVSSSLSDGTYGGLRISDSGGAATGRPTLEFYNSNPTWNYSLARMFSEIGSSGNNPKFYLQVADSSKVLRDRLVIDKSGNVGIGTTSPQTKLHVNGSAIINGTLIGLSNATDLTGAVTLSQLQAVNTSAAVETDPHWTGNSTLVPYLASANTFTANNIFNGNLTAGSGALFVNNNTGNVGIGTANPSGKLTVDAASALVNSIETAGTLNLRSTTAYGIDIGPQLRFSGETGTGATPYAFATIAGRKESASANHPGYLQFSTTDSGSTINERMRITSTGKVGIGTTSPASVLHINSSDTSANSGISLSNGLNSDVWKIWLGTPGNYDGYLKIGHNPANQNDWKMTMDPSNFALSVPGGLSTPYYRTAITGLGDNSILTWTQGATYSGDLKVGSNHPYGETSVIAILGPPSSSGNPGNTNNSYFSVANQDTPTVKIFSVRNTGDAYFSGNVGIGTTIPQTPLHVAGAGLFNGTVTINNGTSAQHAVTLSQLQAVNVSAGVETDPYWTGNSTLVPYLASANTFTANNIFNQNLTVDGTTFFVNSNTDRVGIGTTAPIDTLAVNGTMDVTGRADFHDSIYVNTNVGAGNSFYFYNNDLLMYPTTAINDTGNAYTFADASGLNLKQIKASSLLIRSTSTGTTLSSINNDGSGYFSGNVGIGTTIPGEELEVAGNINSTGGDICITGGNCLSDALSSYTETDPYWTGNFTARTGTGNVVFSASPTLTGLTINSPTVTLSQDTNFVLSGGVNGISFDTNTLSIDATNHRVGIGTTSPGEKLEVVGGNLKIVQASDSGFAGLEIFESTGAVAGVIRRDAGANGALVFRNRGEDTLAIGQGDVGIGTTSPQNELNVIGDINFTGLIYGNGSQLTGLPTGGTPAGNDGYVQFNNNGTFGASNRFVWNNTLTKLEVNAIDISDSLEMSGSEVINSTGSWLGTTIPINKGGTGKTSFSAGQIHFGDFLQDSNLFWDNTEKRLGIGTTSPLEALDVMGNIRLRSGVSGVTISGGNAAGPLSADPLYIKAGGDAGGPGANLYLDGGVGISNSDGDVLLTTQETGGNVGIGTTSPGAKLDVRTNTTNAIEWGNTAFPVGRLTYSGNDAQIYSQTGGGLSLGSDATAGRMYIDSDGEVGIGTTTPGAKLHVVSNSATNFLIQDSNSATLLSITGNAAADNIVGQFGTNGINFKVDSANGYLTLNGGEVGIGTTTPNQALQVTGNVNVSGTVYAGAFSSNSPLLLQTGGTTRMYIADTGIQAGSVGIGTTSPSQKLDVVGNIKSSTDIIAGGVVGGTGASFEIPIDDGSNAFLITPTDNTLTERFGGFLWIPNVVDDPSGLDIQDIGEGKSTLLTWDLTNMRLYAWDSSNGWSYVQFTQ